MLHFDQTIDVAVPPECWLGKAKLELLSRNTGLILPVDKVTVSIDEIGKLVSIDREK